MEPLSSPESLVRRHAEDAAQTFGRLAEACGPDIVRAATSIEAALRNNGHFWLFGNGGSAIEWPATLTKLLALDFETVIPGHGSIMTKDDIRTFRRKLETVIDRVTDQIAAGATRADIASRVDTNDRAWPLAPVRIQNVFDELTAAP